MIKKIIFISSSLVLINKIYAFDIRQINNAKIMSKASYAVNNTNIIDKENAEDILENITDLNKALKDKEKEIIQNNKNIINPKFKGA